ncbi:MAG: hypothetical protein EP350_02835 [Alphaproteobacteria bacterium]|nr:MAG: hypothetical protein EP350_02835 [Alphaproteobacteria bacterium]
MILFLRAALFVGGLFYVILGVGFLLDPAGSGSDFGLAAQGPHGLATIRADITAFFVVAGGCMIWGGWARKGDPLLVTAALMLLALLGRSVGLAMDGSYAGYWPPMVVEAVTVILALVASRMLPHTALEPDS